MSFFRKNVQTMTGYVPGEQPTGGDYVKLNTNECPYPPSPRVKEVLERFDYATLRLYPDPTVKCVRDAVSKVYGVKPDQVLVGTGSDDILDVAMRAFVDPGGIVAYPTPTYSLYPELARIQDALVMEIPFEAGGGIPEGLARTGAALTFLCNPNAPTGTIAPVEEVEALAAGSSGVLLVDEAYADFADATSLGLVNSFRNVVVARTLSKSFALAGVRCGYAVATPEMIAGMTKVRASYPVDRLSAAIAAAAIEDEDYTRSLVERIVATRDRTRRELLSMGFDCQESHSNFLLARTPRARELYTRLKERRILVRYFDKPELADAIRITIGTEEEMDVLLAALRKMVG